MDKQCSKCKESKDIGEFHKDKQGKHGVQAYCKICSKSYNQTPERKAYQVVFGKAYNQTDAGKARSARYAQTPERKAYSREYMKAWAQSPEGKASMAARKQSPEGRFKDSQIAARRRKLDFNISESFHADLIQKPCHYCYGPLNATGCGMDRVDSSKGYTETNVVSCCGSCNTMKSDKLTYDEMVLVWEYRRKIAVV